MRERIDGVMTTTTFPQPEPYNPTDFHYIEVTAKVTATVRGNLIVTSALVRKTLGIPEGEPVTDEDLIAFAENDDLDGVDLEVVDIHTWDSTEEKVLRRATTNL